MREHKLRICLIALSLVFFFLGLFLKIVWWGKLIFYLASAILVGYNVVLNAISNICHGRIFDENLLMSVASICAFAIGEFAEGALVLILSQIGELLQSIAVGKSRKEIASIMA